MDGELVRVAGGLDRIEQEALKAVERGDYKRYLTAYFRYCRETGKAPAERETIREYLESLKGKYHGGSFPPILSAIKKGLRGASLSLLDARGAMAVSEALRHVKTPKVQNHVPRTMILTREEEKASLALMTKRDALLFRFLLKTGLRISEALAIRLSDLKEILDGVEIPVHGKGGKIRTVIVCRSLIAEIRETFRGRTYLFETENGKPIHRVYAYMRIRRAVEKATGKRFSPHGCRHTFATRAIHSTGKLKAVADFLGHSSTATTLNMYTHETLSVEELERI